MIHAQYIANMQARFPQCFRVDGSLDRAKLATMENAEMRKSLGGSLPRDPISPEDRERYERRSAAARARADAAMHDLLSKVTGTMTTGDIATKTGLTRGRVAWLMDRAAEQELVIKGSTKRVLIWTKPEDVQPEPPKVVEKPKRKEYDPVEVIVRDEVFPSLSACAKHFGITVQAVACAVRKGRQDTIGLRKGVRR